MIEKISVKNFKCHAHTEIELGKVTALVGPNGAGKSTMLQAIYALNQLVHSIIKGSWSWEALNSMVRRQQSEWSICVTSSYPDWQIEVARKLASSPKDTWTLNQIELDGSNQTARQGVAECFGQAVYFQGIARHLASPSSPLKLPPKLADDGSELASVLADLMISDRKRRSQIEQSLCAIVPTIKEMNARTVPVKRKEKKVFSVNGAQFPYEEERDVPGSELIFNTLSGDEIPARDMSEGTLLTLGLLTLLYGSSDDVRLFLLDDIEHGLHPLAQRKLMQTLKKFAKDNNRQIILASHSPYIVDELDAKDIWVLATDEQGVSHVKRLYDHPDRERALEVLSTGEFLSAEGESWVLPNATLTEHVTEQVNA